MNAALAKAMQLIESSDVDDSMARAALCVQKEYAIKKNEYILGLITGIPAPTVKHVQTRDVRAMIVREVGLDVGESDPFLLALLALQQDTSTDAVYESVKALLSQREVQRKEFTRSKKNLTAMAVTAGIAGLLIGGGAVWYLIR